MLTVKNKHGDTLELFDLKRAYFEKKEWDQGTQITEYLKQTYQGKRDIVNMILEVYGGQYYVIGFQSNNYGSYIAFSYWSGAFLIIKCTDNTWLKSTIATT